MKNARRIVTLLFILCLALSVTACKKKTPVITPEEPVTDTGVQEVQPQGEPTPPVVQPIAEEELNDQMLADITRQLQPVFYDYNRADIREDQIAALQNNARVLKQYGKASVLIEGHCDERGTDEYNLALGERRAGAAKEYLVSLGIAEGRISTISYGESKPFAEGHNDDAWQQNRRAHFIALKK